MHECGHVMHAALSTAEFCMLRGIDVQWDFVEVFSQFFEQYSFSQDFLKLFINDQTIIDRLVASRKYANGYSLCRQLTKSYLDMIIH